MPPCPESGVWNYCFGTYTDDDGTRYVGEWKNDKSHGQGTETYVSGAKSAIGADGGHGRGQVILQQRERIKQKTIETRRLHHLKYAA